MSYLNPEDIKTAIADLEQLCKKVRHMAVNEAPTLSLQESGLLAAYHYLSKAKAILEDIPDA